MMTGVEEGGHAVSRMVDSPGAGTVFFAFTTKKAVLRRNVIIPVSKISFLCIVDPLALSICLKGHYLENRKTFD